MDELLGHLHEQGAVDSTGHFTMARHARAKLRKFQLLEPNRFVLLFVAAACAGGARRVGVDFSGQVLEFLLEGFAPHPEEARGLLDCLFQADQVPSALRNLAVGVNAAFGLSHTVTLESWTGTSGVRLEWLCDEEDLDGSETRLSSSPWGTVGTRIRVELKEFRTLIQVLTRDLGTRRLELLREYCAFAPIPVGGKAGGDLRTQPDFKSAVAVVCLQGSARMPGYVRQHAPGVVSLERPVRGSWSALLILSPERDDFGLRWVRHGILMRVDVMSLGPQVRAVVWDDTLRSNLSFSNLVEDEAYDKVLQQVQQALHDAVWDFINWATPPRGSDKMAPLVRRVMPEWSPQRRTQGHAWLLEAARNTTLDPMENCTLRLEAADGLADPAQAESLRLRVLDELHGMLMRSWGERQTTLHARQLTMACETAHRLPIGPEVERLALFLKLSVCSGEYLELARTFAHGRGGFARALALALDGELEEARTVLESGPRHAGAEYLLGLLAMRLGAPGEAEQHVRVAQQLAMGAPELARTLEARFYLLPEGAPPSKRFSLQQQVVEQRRHTAGEALLYHNLELRRLALEAGELGTWASLDFERFRARWCAPLTFYFNRASLASVGQLLSTVTRAEQTLRPDDPWLAAHVDIAGRQLARQGFWRELSKILTRQLAREELVKGGVQAALPASAKPAGSNPT